MPFKMGRKKGRQRLKTRINKGFLAVTGLPGAGGGGGKKEPKKEGICWRKGRGTGPEDGQQGAGRLKFCHICPFCGRKCLFYLAEQHRPCK